MGLIFISHDLNLVASFCDRVLIMYAGRIVEELRRQGAAQARHPYTRGLLRCLPRSAIRRAPSSRCCDRDPAWRIEAGRGPVIESGPLASSSAAAPRGRGGRPASRFRVDEGESFGLVGESGSGKSTVLRAIAGLHRRLAGTDHDRRPSRAGHAPRHRLLQPVQMVFQDPYGSLHPRHTVDRILAEPLRSTASATPTRRIARALGRGRPRPALPLPLPASALGRPAPAGRDRPRADHRARGRCCSTSRPRRSTSRSRPRS